MMVRGEGREGEGVRAWEGLRDLIVWVVAGCGPNV